MRAAGHELLGARIRLRELARRQQRLGESRWGWLMGRTVYLWPDCDAKRRALTKAERDAGVDPESEAAAARACCSPA
jgi:hypothetical protein